MRSGWIDNVPVVRLHREPEGRGAHIRLEVAQFITNAESDAVVGNIVQRDFVESAFGNDEERADELGQNRSANLPALFSEDGVSSLRHVDDWRALCLAMSWISMAYRFQTRL